MRDARGKKMNRHCTAFCFDKIRFEILKDFVEKVRKEIDKERKDRELNEETLLTLLEEACGKLNYINTDG